MTNHQLKEVLWKLIESANKYDDLGVAHKIIHNKPMALQFLKMFDSENILNQSFVERVLEGREMSSLGNISRRDVSNLLGAILICVVSVIFPQVSDADSGELLWVMIVSPSFLNHTLLELVGTEQYFVSWKKNPLARIIKESTKNLGKRYNQWQI